VPALLLRTLMSWLWQDLAIPRQGPRLPMQMKSSWLEVQGGMNYDRVCGQAAHLALLYIQLVGRTDDDCKCTENSDNIK
jgi:hypothetical protein